MACNKLTIKGASIKYGIPSKILRDRIDLYGLSLDEAIEYGRSNRGFAANPPTSRLQKLNHEWCKKRITGNKTEWGYFW